LLINPSANAFICSIASGAVKSILSSPFNILNPLG
jgi:hypothetical protein